MNLRKLGRMFGFVAAVAVLAMVLQGCGGGDNGTDQGLQDQLDALQGEVDGALMGLPAGTDLDDLRMMYNNLMGAVDTALMDLDDDVTVQSLRTMYDALMYSVDMALTGLADVTVQDLRDMYENLMAEVAMAVAGIDPNDAAALRTAYDSVKSSHDMLMADVAMALLNTGADDVAGLRSMYDTLMGSNTALMTAVETALANTTATNVAGLRSLYDTLMSDYDGLMGDVTMALANTTATNVAGLRSMYDTLKTNYDGLMGDVTMALANTTATNVAGLRDLYDALVTANAGLTTMNTDLNTQLMQAQTARDKYKEMYEDAKEMLDEANDLQGNLDARRDAEAIQYLAGRTARMLNADEDITDAGEAAIMPMMAQRNDADPRGSLSLGCSDGMMCPTDPATSTRITKLRDAPTVNPWSSVMRDGDSISFEVIEGTEAEHQADGMPDVISRIKAEDAAVSDVSDYPGWVSVILGGGLSGGGTENFNVYTNAKEVPFGDDDSLHPFDVSPAGDDNLTLLAVTDEEIGETGDFNTARGTLTGAELAAALKTWVEGRVATVEFTSELTEGNLVRNVPDGQDVAVDGTFGGVNGKFYCQRGDATDCQITRTVVGSTSYYTVATGDVWWFRPDAGSMVPNEDYMIFGAWLSESAVSAGHRTAGAFADGGEPFTTANINGLEGEATYKGPAAGYYAERTAQEAVATSGSFTATAELTADFAEGDAGTLMGEIKDFYVGSDMKDWQVELQMGDIGVSGNEDNGFTRGTTAGAAGSRRWEGTWGAQFFGNGEADGDHPTGVAGAFSAATGDPHPLVSPSVTTNPLGVPYSDPGFVGVVGGFGADLVVPPMDDTEGGM